jgi:hypothetical protein
MISFWREDIWCIFTLWALPDSKLSAPGLEVDDTSKVPAAHQSSSECSCRKPDALPQERWLESDTFRKTMVWDILMTYLGHPWSSTFPMKMPPRAFVVTLRCPTLLINGEGCSESQARIVLAALNRTFGTGSLVSFTTFRRKWKIVKTLEKSVRDQGNQFLDLEVYKNWTTAICLWVFVSALMYIPYSL